MAEIYKLFSTEEPIPKTHDLGTANRLIPLIRRYTEEAVNESESVGAELSQFSPADPQYKKLSDEYDRIVMRWVERIHRLGALAKGLWLVDFDTGDGYLCWVYPEDRVEFFHGYDQGFKHRRKLEADQLRHV